MSKNYVIGFPRIGEKRELKKVLEDYWAKKVDFSEVKYVAENLRKRYKLIKTSKNKKCILICLFVVKRSAKLGS